MPATPSGRAEPRIPLPMAAQPVQFPLSADDTSYISSRMSEVSRSFALVVPRIEKPLGDHLAAAYLICRVVDNVEDCAAPPRWRVERFDELDRLLTDRRAVPDVLSSWQGHAWPGLTREERYLMSLDGGARLWDVYWAMPDVSRAHVSRWTRTMVEGMRRLAVDADGAWTADGSPVRRPRHVDDYNRYCFVVAGTVGHMATDLVIDHFRLGRDSAERLRALSDACGRGLQKTNIVKDFAQDLARSICYLPDDWLLEVGRAPLALLGAPLDWTRRVIGDVLGELREATDYVRALPIGARGYRMATLLCLLPAYATLHEAARRHDSLFTAAHHVKISRATMAGCLSDAAALVEDDGAILAYSRRAECLLDRAFNSPKVGAES